MTKRFDLDEMTPARFVDLAALYGFNPRVQIAEDASWKLIVDIHSEGLSQDELNLWAWTDQWIRKPRECFPATDHSNLWLVTIETLRRGLIAAESASHCDQGGAA